MTQPHSGAHAPDPRAELSSMVEAGLGRAVDADVLSQLLTMQERLQNSIGELSALLIDHKITRQEYVKKLDQALIEARRAGQAAMGAKNFYKVFGDMRADQLGDVSAFLAEH